MPLIRSTPVLPGPISAAGTGGGEGRANVDHVERDDLSAAVRDPQPDHVAELVEALAAAVAARAGAEVLEPQLDGAAVRVDRPARVGGSARVELRAADVAVHLQRDLAVDDDPRQRRAGELAPRGDHRGQRAGPRHLDRGHLLHARREPEVVPAEPHGRLGERPVDVVEVRRREPILARSPSFTAARALSTAARASIPIGRATSGATT